MTRQARDIDRQVGCRASAFEVAIENFWTDRLTRLPPGRSTEVWLTPRWALAMRYHPMSTLVGHYSREVALGAFREDCFFVLNQGGRR